MIELEEINYIGKGTNRACYIHPDDINRCIKVTISNNFSESEKEIKYYKFLEKKNIKWQYLAKYHGKISTNLGSGGIFDLVRDDDGTISKTLSYYLQKNELTKSILDPVPLLEELRKYTLEEGIVVKDLNTKNMLYQKIDTNHAKLILIDGVLNNDLFFYSNYFDSLTHKKIDSLWNNFENSLSKKYAFNKYFINLLKRLK